MGRYFLRVLTFPLSLVYGAIVGIRNILYDTGVLHSVQFSIPVISVGNLSVGGTGKTPHVEYLIRFLSRYIRIGVLSRGYKRSTRGFVEVRSTHDARQVGDEPLMYKLKYPDLPVAVAESRVLGIPELLNRHPDIQTVLLDDAFQHREVHPYINILLTEYARPFFEDHLLPMGTLREGPSAMRRADIILVTKCPETLTPRQANDFIRKIQPLPHQKVFFTRYRYAHPYAFFDPAERRVLRDQHTVLLVAGIARTGYLTSYLVDHVGELYTLEYGDHHYFSARDMDEIWAQFRKIDASEKYILTTEKDAVRLYMHRERIAREGWPLYILPVMVEFLLGGEEEFQKTIKETLMQFRV